MPEQMITLDQAADQVIASVRERADLPDKSERSIHRTAEAEAWANAEIADANGDEQGKEQWSALAGKIGDKYQEAMRKQKSKK